MGKELVSTVCVRSVCGGFGRGRLCDGIDVMRWMSVLRDLG